MGKSRELGWAWRPGPGEGPPVTNREERRDRKRKLARKAKRKRKNWLLYAPGEVFYESKAWKRLRRLVLEKYGYKCMRCEAVDTEMHVDHIEPRSLKPRLSLAFSNLQVLCRACNKEKSNLYAYDFRDEALDREAEIAIAREAAARI